MRTEDVTGVSWKATAEDTANAVIDHEDIGISLENDPDAPNDAATDNTSA